MHTIREKIIKAGWHQRRQILLDQAPNQFALSTCGRLARLEVWRRRLATTSGNDVWQRNLATKSRDEVWR